VIVRLRLKNWRNYTDLDLTLGTGTTFIVAPNGVGKTSLMEAASWAVFGDSGQGHHPGNAVRAGTPAAEATVDIELPDETRITIRRVLPKRRGIAAPRPVVSLATGEAGPEFLAAQMLRHYGADLDFLARLTMPPRFLDQGSTSGLGLHGHLCRLFGVDRLLEAAGEVERRIKELGPLIKEAKVGMPATAALVDGLKRDLDACEAQFAETIAAHERVSAQLEGAREAARARTRLSDWQERADTFSAALADLATAAAPHVTLDPGHPETAQERLDAALAVIARELEELRVRRAVLEGKAEAIEQHSATLMSATGDCPVCKRPLDAAAADFATSAHAGQLARIDAECRSLSELEAGAAARQARLRVLMRAFRDLAPPGPRPEPGTAGEGTPAESLEAEAQRLFSELLGRNTAVDLARAKLRRTTEDAHAHTALEELYTREAVLRASRSAISATTTRILDQTIAPLTTEINARWQQLFPQRGRLRTRSTGEVSREVNGEELPFDDFSTGERMGLVVLLRLLVLEMATKANFCWFDEPLEHLDPDARRQVAESLARASIGGPLKQIVVTTYEETLARRLHERHPDTVNLIYVRQAARS
jgi:DNA repair exonuclease SbcCD ATPase subunit